MRVRLLPCQPSHASVLKRRRGLTVNQVALAVDGGSSPPRRTIFPGVRLRNRQARLGLNQQPLPSDLGP